MRTGRKVGALGPCKPVAPITDDALQIATVVNTRIRRTGMDGDDAIVVFVDDGEVYAPRRSSNTAQALAPAQIIGTYTKRAKVGDIADDVRAWKEAA